MKNKTENNLFSVGLVAVCSFIGVGFLTGAEIWFYFARFGVNMVFGLAIFAAISCFLIYFSTNASNSQNKQLNRFKRAVLGVCELLIASAMVSGLSEVSKTLFDKWWLFVFLCSFFFVCLLFLKGVKSFVIYNYFVAGFVIFIILSLFFINNFSSQNLTGDFSIKNAGLSCVFGSLYIFMNISEIRPILMEVGTFASKKSRLILSLTISLLLIFLVFLLSVILFFNKSYVSFSMPFLLLFKNNGGLSFYVFLLSLFLAMISTAVSCLIGAKNRFFENRKDEKFEKSFVIISSLILGQIPFSCFVKIVYPIIAFLNILLFVFELVLLKRNNRNGAK